ncbi:radical SAM family heme chaperone HemW [Parvularcula sp. ZS-1/3]|uniref:Heme chaperone HemW n=1 Tax=Parvularcula mediterranea TaxID=2732508 RepID=A0A7Y3RLB3_9PROT|nr:radical SAM family heme chaperone HemW [Parvularcula mediterranea]
MRPLGLYVHWPFCARICPYCDFTIAKNRAVDEAAWTEVLLDDLRFYAELTEKRALRSIYFGGGTPSLIPPSVAEAVLSEAERLFGREETCELTVEANPDDASRFEMLAGLGFHRLSLGIQSFDDAELKFFGRNHDASEARSALDEALRVFSDVSFDLIYALPDQELGAWRDALAAACDLGADHLSLYQLTIEEGTAFGRAAEKGRLIPMPDDRAADFYEVTQEVTEAAGMPAYEVSNHAKPGSEARHNSLYWQDAEWIGIGPGAHGRLGGEAKWVATRGAAVPVRYPSLPQAERLVVEELSLSDVRLEALAGGLRPVAGLDLSRLGDDAPGVLECAGPLVEAGLLTEQDGRLRASPSGRLVLDQLTALLAEGLAG